MTIESDEALKEPQGALSDAAIKYAQSETVSSILKVEAAFIAGAQYQRKVDALEIEKLRALILLVDPAVSDVEMNIITQRQWCEYARIFPQEPVDKYELVRTSDGDYV